MNLILLAVVLAAPPQAPVPPQGPPVDEARVRQIVRDELKSAMAALEAQPRAAQPAPAAALPPAAAVTGPATEVVSYDGGRSWVTRAVPGTPAFSTPIRDAVFNFVTPSACAGGQCPTPRRR